MINTTGLAVLTECKDKSDDQQGTEYDGSIMYGRLLFSRLFLQKENKLEAALPGILSRMLLSSPENTWNNDLGACLSILGTRVQMGQVGFDMASKLVSMGYANLTHFSTSTSGVADVCFLPDPVCARLAMGLMLPGYSFDKRGGKNPSFWSDQATRIFSCGLCRPQKGDVGEVAAALYLLFCGDSLRLKANKDLKQFSVPFETWMAHLKKGRTVQGDDADLNDTKDGDNSSPCTGSTKQQAKKKVKKEGDAANLEPMVSFIQVCRNYLRIPLKSMCDSRLLEAWYKAGRALYVFPGCPAFDIIAPLRYFDSIGQTHRYCPVLISVKNRLQYSGSQREAAISAMVDALESAGEETAVAILLLVGLENPQELLKDVDKQFVHGQITTFEVAVPADDEFGVSSLVHASTNGGGESTEVYASHSEAMFVKDVSVEELLRSKTKRNDGSYQMLERLTLKCKKIADNYTGNDATTMEE